MARRYRKRGGFRKKGGFKRGTFGRGFAKTYDFDAEDYTKQLERIPAEYKLMAEISAAKIGLLKAGINIGSDLLKHIWQMKKLSNTKLKEIDLEGKASQTPLFKNIVKAGIIANAQGRPASGRDLYAASMLPDANFGVADATGVDAVSTPLFGNLTGFKIKI